MRLSRKQLITISLVTVALLVIFSTFILFALQGDDGLVEIDGVPQELWSRELETSQNQDTVQITNAYDGYSVRVPREWRIPETASGASGLSVTYSPEGVYRDDIDFGYGLELSVYTDTLEESQSFENWVQENFGIIQLSQTNLSSYPAQMSSLPLITHNTFLEEVPVENSLVERFFIQKGLKIFVLSCSAEGPDYPELVALCVQQLESFTLLQ